MTQELNGFVLSWFEEYMLGTPLQDVAFMKKVLEVSSSTCSTVCSSSPGKSHFCS